MQPPNPVPPAPLASSDLHRQAIELNNQALACSERGDHSSAIPLYEQALGFFRQLDEIPTSVEILGELGKAQLQLNNYQKAADHLQEAAQLSQLGGDIQAHGTCLSDLALVYRQWGQYEQALHHAQQALAVAQSLGDPLMQGEALDQLALTYRRMGQSQQAIEAYEKALALSRSIGNRNGEAYDLGGLGNAYNDLKRYDQAVLYYEQARMIFREMGAAHLVSQCDDRILVAKTRTKQKKKAEANKAAAHAASNGAKPKSSRAKLRN
jgi:tetratricopeptide (TPR) repeat protein